jgi:hypothetical protein
MIAMFWKSHRRLSEDPKKPEDSGKLSLRWGLIILASCIAGVAVGCVAGIAVGVGTGIALAVGLDQMLAKT